MKATLSESILLGSVFIEKPDPSSWCGCAVGMAAASLVGKQFREWEGDSAYARAVDEWPILMQKVPIPSILRANYRGCVLWGLIGTKGAHVTSATLELIISCAFMLVCEKQMTLEALVDMVRDIEKQFPLEQSAPQLAVEQPEPATVC